MSNYSYLGDAQRVPIGSPPRNPTQECPHCRRRITAAAGRWLFHYIVPGVGRHCPKSGQPVDEGTS